MTSNYKNIINEYTNSQSIQESIENVILAYSFLDMTDEKIKEILDEAFQSIKNNNYEKAHLQVKKIFENYIREQLKNFDTSIKLINDYINNKLDIYSSKYLQELNKLKDFFAYYNYSFDIDNCIALLKSNKVLNDILGSIFKFNQDNLLKENYYAITKDEFIITLIETYIDFYDLNQIKPVEGKESPPPKKGILTREEEIELVKKMQAGDKSARKKLIEKNTRLVKKIASRYVNRGVEFEDLIEEGIIGLIKAIDAFDLDKGCKLSTYSIYWIKQSIKRSIYDQGSTIRTPVHVHEKKVTYEKAFNKIELETGKPPTKEEIMEKTGLTDLDIEKIYNTQRGIVSLNTKTSDDDNANEILDFIPDENQNVLRITEENILKEELYKLLREILDERELKIIVRKNGLDGGDPETLEDIGQTFHLTRERIRQIHDKALRKLRSNPNFKKFFVYINGGSPSNLPPDSEENKKPKKNITQEEIEKNRATLIVKASEQIHWKNAKNKKKNPKKDIYERYPEYTKEEINQAIECLDNIGLLNFKMFLKYLNGEYDLPRNITTSNFYDTFAKIEYNLIYLFGNRLDKSKMKLYLITKKYIDYIGGKKLKPYQDQSKSSDFLQDYLSKQISKSNDNIGDDNMQIKKDIYTRYPEYTKEEINQAIEWLDEKGHSYYETFVKYINGEFKLPKGSTTSYFYSTFAKIEYNLMGLFGNRFKGKTKLSLISDTYVQYFDTKKLSLNNESHQEQPESADIQKDTINEPIDNIEADLHRRNIYTRYPEYTEEEINQAIEWLDGDGQYYYTEFLKYLKNEFTLPKVTTISYFYNTFAKIEYNLIELFGNRFSSKTMIERISNTYIEYFKNRRLSLISKSSEEKPKSADIHKDTTNEPQEEPISELNDNIADVIPKPEEITDSGELSPTIEALPIEKQDKPELSNDDQTLLTAKKGGLAFISNTESREENGVLNMLEINSFQQLMKIMPNPEAIVFALYAGYFRGHRFNLKEISDFLYISEEETLNLAKKASILFKEKINDLLDKEFTQNKNSNDHNLNENNDNLYYLMNHLSNSEALIVALYSGFFKCQSFNIQEISSFFNIEESETLNIIRKVMFAFKERINNILNQEAEEQLTLNKTKTDK